MELEGPRRARGASPSSSTTRCGSDPFFPPRTAVPSRDQRSRGGSCPSSTAVRHLGPQVSTPSSHPFHHYFKSSGTSHSRTRCCTLRTRCATGHEKAHTAAQDRSPCKLKTAALQQARHRGPSQPCPWLAPEAGAGSLLYQPWELD